MKRLILIAALLCCTPAFSQILPISPRSISLNQQQVLVAEAAGTVFLNPSMLLEQPKMSAWLTHSRPYALADLPAFGFAGHYRTERAAFAVGLLDFGNALYSDQTISLAGALSISTRFHFGLNYRLRLVEISGYGSARTSALHIGFHLPVSDRITLGGLMKNVSAGQLGGHSPEREALLAMRVSVAPDLRLYTELAQAPHFDAENRFGFEYQPASFLSLRAGTGLNTPAGFSGGFGIQWQRLQLIYAIQNHPALEETHIFALTFAR